MNIGVLYEQYYNKGKNYVRWLGAHESDVEDLVQEAFLRLLSSGVEDSEASWFLLRVILRRLVLDGKKRPLEELRDNFDSLESLPLTYPEVSFQVPPEVWYRVVEGYSFVEIGEILKITKDAARMRFNRGLRSLRRKLSKN